ncbi:cytochrome P450 89A2-like [Senna tora]|uniref:Cytochrome P450 89A2-like n=1 Tax=Senna tora TaxID=362788 RepID=A0A834SWW0_9FABA|nr:cytochrome P450 89A2-like [Senna tora]
MELWFIFFISLSLFLFLKSLFFPSNKTLPLPPGPPRLSIIGSLPFLLKSFFQNQSLLRNLHSNYGPILTLTIGPRLFIFISDSSLAHSALIQNAAVFSDRPTSTTTANAFNSNQHDISSAFYGPNWRLLRRNLTSHVLHPTRIRSFSGTREWVLHVLMDRLKEDSESRNSVKVIDHFQYAMFCLLVFMCFGDRLDEKEIREIECVVRKVLLSFNRFRVLNFWPRITRVLFHKRWKELLEIKKERDNVLIPLIRARESLKKAQNDNEFIVSYVDTLLELEWPQEKRKLDESEIVSLCYEFLVAGAHTTATALHWIMANLVKYPHIQEKVVEEIREVMGERDDKEVVKEEDLNKIPYLKAVILEGLRRHPPAHFVVPHAVSEDVVLNGYLVPKKGRINFMVAEMGWDPKVWENPMEFKPERFLKDEEEFDITGSKEIKMMPFGAGRRMCPGHNLAMLHLEYFVANLVWNFEWKAANGDVDLSEKQALTVVMKNPLNVCLSPRV